MRKLILICLQFAALPSIGQLSRAQIMDTINTKLPDNNSRLIRPVDFRIVLGTLLNYAASADSSAQKKTPYTTATSFRGGSVGTPNAVILTDKQGGTYLYNAANTTAADDTAMVIRVGTKRYERVVGTTLTPEIFGAVGNGIEDDTRAIRKAIAAGMVIVLNKTYKVTDTLNLRQGQTLSGSGTIDLTFATTKKGGINAASFCTIEGLTINQRSTSSVVSGQDNVCILVGYFTFQAITPTNVTIRNCKLNMYSPAGQVLLEVLGSNNVLVENVRFQNYSTATTATGCHWAMKTGTPSEGTIHPYNITYRNCEFLNFGATNNTTTAGVLWIAASSNILIESCKITGAGNSAVYLFAGDYGYYYGNTDAKKRQFRNIVVRNVQATMLPKTGINVIGKAVLAPGAPVYTMDINIQNVYLKNDSTGNISSGIIFANVSGATVSNSTIEGFYVGIYAQLGSKNILIQNLKIRDSGKTGVYINNDTSPPEDIVISGCTIENTGSQSLTAGAGIEIGNSRRTVVRGNIFGRESGTDLTTWGVRVATQANPVAAIIENNFVRNVKAGGVGYSLGNASDTGLVYKLEGNRAATGITFKGGSKAIPIERN